jgi:hypothetical protein
MASITYFDICAVNGRETDLTRFFLRCSLSI